jgi:CDP-diacylglycerol--glycerol-3-phosphate 3-phosphatidyltransferase
MTLPNKLTLSRLFSAPLVFLAWYLPIHLGHFPRPGTIILWVLFILSEITDVLDGHFARSRGQVSDVGKLMDPFSDVFLRVTYFACFLGAGLMPVWTLVIILWRELGIMFIRMLLAREGVALAANKGGKLKSFLYFVSGFGGVFALTLRAWVPDLNWLSQAERVVALLFVVAAVASLVSFADYFRQYLKTDTHKTFMAE